MLACTDTTMISNNYHVSELAPTINDRYSPLYLCCLCLLPVHTISATMSAKTNGFAQGTVLKVAYSMLGLTSSVVLARIGLNIIRPRRLTASDYFVFVAFAIYVTMCALYIALSPYMQRVYAVSNREIPPYPDLRHDSMMMAKMVFIAFCMFWAVLWSIKLSLLLLYRRLLNGISPRWTFVWWCIAGICLVVRYHSCADFGSTHLDDG